MTFDGVASIQARIAQIEQIVAGAASNSPAAGASSRARERRRVFLVAVRELVARRDGREHRGHRPAGRSVDRRVRGYVGRSARRAHGFGHDVDGRFGDPLRAHAARPARQARYEHRCVADRRWRWRRSRAAVLVGGARAAGQAVRVRHDERQRPQPEVVRLRRPHEVGRRARRHHDAVGATAQYLYVRDHGDDDERATGAAHARRVAVPLLARAAATPATFPPTATSRSASATACTRSKRAVAPYGTNEFANAGGRPFNFAGMIPGM